MIYDMDTNLSLSCMVRGGVVKKYKCVCVCIYVFACIDHWEREVRVRRCDPTKMTCGKQGNTTALASQAVRRDNLRIEFSIYTYS